MPKMTFHEYQSMVMDSSRRPPNWRLGQTAFNWLYDIRPDLSEQIRATDLDPFHLDSVMPAFMAWVQQHWDDSPS